ncbi:MAG: hypothetical protein Q8M07_30550 [Prosthecobacter sp.]|nr:hypothetical protein [Prosthecobacter sp.]
MSSVLEIEKAIEALAPEQRREVRDWLNEHDGLVDAAGSVFALYDAEEGEGQQWHD